VTPAQILWLLVLEVPIYTINSKIAEHLGALDVGGSITIHAFGAFYGLAASKVSKPPTQYSLSRVSR
jgi:ammonium transporter Rh